MYNTADSEVSTACVMLLSNLILKLTQDKDFYSSNTLCRHIVSKTLSRCLQDIISQPDPLQTKISLSLLSLLASSIPLAPLLPQVDQIFKDLLTGKIKLEKVPSVFDKLS